MLIAWSLWRSSCHRVSVSLPYFFAYKKEVLKADLDFGDSFRSENPKLLQLKMHGPHSLVRWDYYARFGPCRQIYYPNGYQWKTEKYCIDQWKAENTALTNNKMIPHNRSKLDWLSSTHLKWPCRPILTGCAITHNRFIDLGYFGRENIPSLK